MMPRPDGSSFGIGALVHLVDAPIVPYTVRTVVGVEPDGACLTAYVSPPPWMTEPEVTRFYRVDPDHLEPVPERVAEELELAPVHLEGGP